MHFDNKIQSCNSLSGLNNRGSFSEFLYLCCSQLIQQENRALEKERFFPHPASVHTWEQKKKPNP